MAVLLLSMAGISYYSVSLLATLNYGGIILGLTALLLLTFKNRHDILCGLLWALIMIKPQIGLLFFWPLLWSKRYKTIVIAVMVCILATLFPAFIYHQSPLELLLQIPQIGAPYIEAGKGSYIGIAKLLGGSLGTTLWTGACFVGCGLLSFILRNASSVINRFIPVFIIFPIWTYSQIHDRVVLVILFFAVIRLLFKQIIVPTSITKLTDKFLLCGFVFWVLSSWVTTTWILLVFTLKWFNPAGYGWIYHLMGQWILFFPVLAMFCLYLKNRQKEELQMP